VREKRKTAPSERMGRELSELNGHERGGDRAEKTRVPLETWGRDCVIQRWGRRRQWARQERGECSLTPKERGQGDFRKKSGPGKGGEEKSFNLNAGEEKRGTRSTRWSRGVLSLS